MLTPDVNVLVAAYRADHPHHRPAREWLEAEVRATTEGSRLLLLPMVCVSFVRLVTHPRIFPVAATAAEALGFIDALLATPGCQMAELDREWPVFAALCAGHSLCANIVQDAWIAAIVRTTGAKLATFDRDFLALLDAHELTLLSPA
ncbi:MAG TPA: TA system VapC family ribonuclease toxin [Burkholderiaceae bacterium]|nr:TA system VapC family ribonuclease toxin [Burkholderiaceae bacterium]